MTIARNWLTSLWASSFKGTPFFTEHDAEAGGRRVVVHQYPMRDDPYLEDLGEDKRDFVVTAYVASDSADTDAGTLVATCATRGPGILVLPTHGPILVRCLRFTRQRSKDKHGYIAFDLNFTREGASSALVTTALLANLTFIAADSLAVAAAAAFVANVQIANQADYVVAAASDGLQNALATIDAVRTGQCVDPTVSATQRDAIQSLFTQTPDLIADPTTIASVPAGIIAAARAIGDGMAPAVAAKTFDEIISDPSSSVTVLDVYPTPNRLAQAENAAEAARVLRMAAIAAYCEAVVRISLGDRPTGITLRANVAEYLEAELDVMPPGEIDLYHAIAAMRDATINYLSRVILDLAPVLTVEANLSMPSLYWAWRLYADPNRSTELVARNQVVHPSFMPPKFEALAE